MLIFAENALSWLSWLKLIIFNEMDADTFEPLNKAPQMIQIGSTTVSNGSRHNAAGSNESKPLVPDDVFIYLEGTGLLYRSVMLVQKPPIDTLIRRSYEGEGDYNKPVYGVYGPAVTLHLQEYCGMSARDGVVSH